MFLERQTINEQPISPECRLAICLYRLSRGDYFYTISEMVGLGVSTVSTIVNEVSEAIVDNMWQDCVNVHMPQSQAEFKKRFWIWTSYGSFLSPGGQLMAATFQ
ncbi:hypothetical protein OS493_017524 [Desmophyllum pertusum]|uniref:Transposase Helix-turn-helix domain-containing protein n=1 Tax=Desmophyllum pertusum TaxID=174260 RepID=A0A9W9ZSH4_9CNID|nr:hypothetical protein OS493_017524 [Desmophyllum pertusum]